MTDWAKLAEPFPDDEVKQRPGAATWDHKSSCEGARCRDTKDPAKHIQFSYIDARAVAQRLDDVLTPAGWQFTCTALPGDVVHGRLIVLTDSGDWATREDHGYPNSDRDEEPLKAATSDALKRCAVLFGIGRHLYDDNKAGHQTHKNGHSGQVRSATPQRAAPPPRSSTAVSDPYADLPYEGDPAPTTTAPSKGWTFKELAAAAEAKGVPKTVIYSTADHLFGRGTKVTDLQPDQREQIAFEMGLVS